MYKKTRKTFYRKNTAQSPKRIKASAKREKKEAIEPVKKESFAHYVPYFLVGVMAIVSIALLGLIALAYANYQEAAIAKQKAQDNFSYWKGVAQEHPNSPDAFYNAALYAVELGEKSEAVKLINEALVLDPAFEEAKELEKKIAE